MTALSVGIHLQNDFNNCGEACAQMVAAFASGVVPQSQDGLAGFKQTFETGWSTSPSDLCRMINGASATTGPQLDYRVREEATPAAAMNYALSALQEHGLPVVALVAGDAHWVVLTGTTAGQTSVVLFRDPRPPRDARTSRGVDQHAANDGCRQWDSLFSSAHTGEAEFRDCRSWLNWFRGATTPPVAGKFVVVGPEVTNVQPLFSCAARRDGVRASAANQRQPIQPQQLADLALAGLESRGLLRLQSWERLARQDRDRVARLARLVSVIDGQPTSAYYLVPLFDGDRVAATVGIDAATGELLWGRQGLAPEYASRLFVERGAEPAGRLVWGVFRETFESPYFPLVQFQKGSDTQPFYWRMFDNEELARLTPP